MNYPQRISRFILGTLFPIRCLACNAIQDGIKDFYLCRICIKNLPLKKSFTCIGCDRLSRLGETCFSCSREFKITRLLTVLDYKDPLVVRLIKTYKYRFVKDIAFSLQYLLKKFLIQLAKEKSFNIAAENPLFVPVPLQKVRENWRGFNQAEIISNLLADSLSLESTSALVKVSSSSPQAEKESKEARLNTQDIYRVAEQEKIKNRHIILVDDVATTGATLNTCAKELLTNGALSVSAVTIARG